MTLTNKFSLALLLLLTAVSGVIRAEDREGAVKNRWSVRAAQEVNVVNDLSGINNHSLDKDVILWYDLQGRRVDAADLLPGIYIRRSGAETRKVTVK